MPLHFIVTAGLLLVVLLLLGVAGWAFSGPLPGWDDDLEDHPADAFETDWRWPE